MLLFRRDALAVIASVLFLVCAGCSSFSHTENRQFKIESTWVRSTLNKEFLGFRRLHRMTPLVLDQMIVQGNGIDGIAAYSKQTGHMLWRSNIENGVEGGAAATSDRLYFGANDGLFYCLDLADGKTKWTFPARAETLSSPAIQNDIVYFQSGADVVYALNKETGKQTWVYNRQVTGQLSIRATTSPVIAGDYLLTGFSDGYVVALKKRDGSLVWERKIGEALRFKDVDSTPVVDGANLYVASFDGSLVSLKLETGEANWTIDQGGFTPVTLGEGQWANRIYYSTAGPEILVIDKADGKILSRIKTTKGIPTQVTLLKSYMMYGESDGAFVVAQADNGDTLARFTPGHGLMSRPALAGDSDKAYFISNSANLYALKLGYQSRSVLLPWQK
jgi:outer membrane protein assembly factor BamB